MAGSRDPRCRMSPGRGLWQSTVHQYRFRLRHSSHFSLSGIVKLGHSNTAGFSFSIFMQVSHIGSLEQKKSPALGLWILCLDMKWLFMVDTEVEMNSHFLHLNSSLMLSLKWTHFLWNLRDSWPLQESKSHWSHLVWSTTTNSVSLLLTLEIEVDLVFNFTTSDSKNCILSLIAFIVTNVFL